MQHELGNLRHDVAIVKTPENNPIHTCHTHLRERPVKIKRFCSVVKIKGFCSVANSHIFQVDPRESHLFNYIVQISKSISLPKRPSDMCTTA